MITGDYEDTAVAIAKELGLLTPEGEGAHRRRAGQDRATRSSPKIVEHVDVYARVSPAHKVRIVEALQGATATWWP